jgi:hypothetical protein
VFHASELNDRVNLTMLECLLFVVQALLAIPLTAMPVQSQPGEQSVAKEEVVQLGIK